MAQLLNYNLPPVVHNYKKGISNSLIICWPVYVYKIVAPKPVESKLNIFQKLVLKMSRSGYYETSVITDVTKLDIKLIEYIKLQLYSYGLLTSEGFITERGNLELKENNYFYDELSIGYIFQDPFSLSLLDQFSENIKFADIDLNSEKRERIFIDEGDSKYAFWVSYKDIPKFIKPTAKEVLNVLSNYSRLRKSADDEYYEIETSNYNKDLFDRITFISEEPELFYLALQTISASSNENAFNIINPFEFNIVDNKITSFVEQKCKIDNNLKEHLLNKHQFPKGEEDLINISLNAESNFQEYVKEKLINIYGEHIASTKLLNTHISYYKLELQTSDFLSYDKIMRQDKMKDMMLRASNFQAVFIKQLLHESDYLSSIPIDFFDDDIEEREKNIKVMLKRIGYYAEIPKPLLLKECDKRKFRNKIKNIDEENEKPLLTILLFSLASEQFNNFAEIIKKDNTLVNRMLQIFDIRNKRSIAHTTKYDPQPEDRQLVINTIKTLSDYYYNIYCKKDIL